MTETGQYPVSVEHKKCSKCGQTKTASDFYTNRHLRSGLASWCKACHQGYGREWKRSEAGKLKQKRDWLKRDFGITPEDYERLLERCDHRCLACGSQKQLHIDHDHATGRIRGILCGNCNRALGLLRDDAIRISQLLEYAKAYC